MRLRGIGKVILSGVICGLEIISGIEFPIYLAKAEHHVSQKGEISQESFIDIAEKVQKSVVSIVREKTVTMSKNEECELRATIREIGSGIIVNPEGYILTSKDNVTGNPEKIKVVFLPEKKEIDAKNEGNN